MEPTTIFAILAIVSLCGLVVGIYMNASGSESGQIVIAASSLLAALFASAWILFTTIDSKSQEFNDKRDLIIPLLSAKFDKVCDRIGLVQVSDLRGNCFEREGLRVWRESGRLYVASLLGSSAAIDLIVDEDRLYGGYFNAIVYQSPSLDLRRLPYVSGSDEWKNGPRHGNSR
ncbi:hypothetical protein D3C71_152620 [compost metagenome]